MEQVKVQSAVILKEEVRHLLDDFAALMKLRSVFFSADGREIERGRNAGCSAYCTYMQEKRFGLAACVALDRAKQIKCMQQKRILSYVCHAGLGEIIAPVLVFDQVAGFLVLGQFRVSDELPECVKTAEEKALYRQLPLFAGDELRNLEHMVKMLLDYIIEKELIGYPEDRRMLRLRQYVEHRLNRKLSLAESARAIGCSESTLTHFLHREGTSFSRLVTEMRLKYAEDLLKNRPDMTLKEIAEISGFQTPYYFSRIFRQFRHTSPGAFRKSVARRSGELH